MKRLKATIILFLLFVLLTAEVVSLEKEEREYEILVDFYTWYNDWYLFPMTYPIRGLYHSGDPIVAAAQNDEKNNFGIKIDLVSYWGPSFRCYDLFKAGYLQASNFETREFCFLYEITGLLLEEDGVFDFANEFNEQKFFRDIQCLEENYFWYPNYYRINGKPVVYIWTSNIKNFGEVSRQIRERVYLIGSEPIFFPPRDGDKQRIQKLRWYDAITSYGIGRTYVAKEYGSLTVDCISEYFRAVIKWNQILKKYTSGVELIMPIQFAYQDNRGDFDEKGNRRTFSSTVDQADRFANTVRVLTNLTGHRRIHLTSYNEHYEGHGSEPSFQYNDLWLRLIKKYFIDWKSRADSPPIYDVIKQRLHDSIIERRSTK
ncbi:MAG: hypothetical protein JSV96_15765 [Candidatus Aminicenantes bacterium]|nr:MAG: hypothetical protein JSV96_15765 [Candidatus Aminicenantes bacterium]